MEIDKRLAAVASIIPNGSSVADIGCDHGRLSVFLAKEKGCSVIAVDKNKKPLEKAKKLAENYNVKLDFRLGDGLACLKPNEVQYVVIAGLSGVTICEMLDGFEWIKSQNTHLILVPHSKHFVLRTFMAKSGYKKYYGVIIINNNRLYPVLHYIYKEQANVAATNS